MRTCIFIRSYHKDLEWFRYCLRSIQKFASGFEYAMAAVPARDVALFTPLAQEFPFLLLRVFDEVEGKGMLSGEIELCRADQHCPGVDAICCLDSDCAFQCPVTPADYMIAGKLRLIGHSFARLEKENNLGVVWKERAERALGFPVEYETMCHPTIYLAETFAQLRSVVEHHVKRPFDEYVLAGRNEFPQDFAELTSLGAVALKFFTDRYRLVDAASTDKVLICDSGRPVTARTLRQYWSRDPVPVAELEELLK